MCEAERLITGGETPPAVPEMVKFEIWCHVGLYYERPWRPTVVLMERRPSEPGDEDTIPLAVLKSGEDSKLTGPVCKTVWELVGMIDLQHAVSVT